MSGAEDPETVGNLPSGRRPPMRRRHRWHGVARLTVTLLVLLSLGFGVLVILASTGKTIRLPVWAVAEVEDRLNSSIAAGGDPRSAMAVSLGGVEVVVAKDRVPSFQLLDVRLRRPDGQILVSLPEARITVDPAALVGGRLQVTSLSLSGAQLTLRRDAEGAFDLAAGSAGASLADNRSFSDLLDAGDEVFRSPALAALDRVDVQGLSLSVTDAAAGRQWELGDGRLVLERRDGALAGDLSVTLIEGGKAPAMAAISVTTALMDSSASLTATVTGMAAPDGAALAAPLAFLSVLDAPISGRISGSLGKDGTLQRLDGALDLGAGSLRAEAGVAPLAFEKAGLTLAYDPATADVTLQRLSVQSRSVRLSATGNIYLRDKVGKVVATGNVPEVILGQVQFSDVQVDPEGLFEAPVRFSSGALDMRLTLRPFRVEIGQLALAEGSEHLLLTGAFEAEKDGWASRFDIALDRIPYARLVKLWPLQLVPKTRDWLVENVQSGNLFNLTAALRTAPGQDPKFSLAYEFAGIDVRFLRGLPPINDGYGRASVEGPRYVMALDRGRVEAPKGGKVIVDGSVFEVPDITQRPSRANIMLMTSASLTATLSLLDQPPFRFLTKVGRPVDLGEGRADLVTRLSLPLVPKVRVTDVAYAATGRISDLTSSVLVPGRILKAGALEAVVTRDGLALSGKGTLDGAPFDASFRQPFGPEAGGKSQIEGHVMLSDDTLRAFGVVLPKGTLAGQADGEVVLDLQKDAPGRLKITSDMDGLAISVPSLGWTKGKGTKGNLVVEMTLGPRPEVTAVTISAAGLAANGTISFRQGGGLDVMHVERLTVGDWLDASVDITGQGAERPVQIALTGGSLDLRRMPRLAASEPGAPPLSVRLDKVIVSGGIALTDLRGETVNKGGLTGDFVSGVNGAGRIQGAIVPQSGGSAIRIRSDDAGQVLRAAGIFSAGRGGALEVVLRSSETPGSYRGTADISSIRVVDAPVLASLLNAISVIGLLEQLNGAGLLFSRVELDFEIESGSVQVSRGAATGASMGVSFAGLYNAETSMIDLQGTISPFYLLNGIGQIFSRRGEGLFGFNYRLRGLADAPDISVNPLSILTPGMFREIFRAAPPTLRNPGG
ncbi:MAG: AsmA-like C-terminal region-containing protein [Pseudomonadota bacterium]